MTAPAASKVFIAATPEEVLLMASRRRNGLFADNYRFAKR
jgi:hypothetical protein